MTPQRGISQKRFLAIVVLGQLHLIEAFMDSLMARATDPDAPIQCFAIDVLAKEGAAMHFSWYQVMEGKLHLSMAKCTYGWSVTILAHGSNTPKTCAWLSGLKCLEIGRNFQ